MAHNSWTEEDIYILKENFNNFTDEELRCLLPNHSKASIATKRRRLGLIRNQSFYTFDDVVDIFNSLGYDVLSSSEEYVNMISPIKYYSDKYGYGSISLDHLFRRHKINKRIKREKYAERENLTKSEIISRIHEVSPSFIIQSDFNYIKDKVDYICTKHNHSGCQTIQNLLTGRGCKKCGYEKMANSNKSTVDEFQNKVYSINPNIEVVDDNAGRFGRHTYKCAKCGVIWDGIFSYTLICPNCERTKSNGEKYIKEILTELDINYVSEKRFEECKDERCLPFDFYLPDYNVCIEYNGLQHYKPIKHFGGEESFVIRQSHDKSKKDYCKNNGIKLIEIPYTLNTQETIKSFIVDNIK